MSSILAWGDNELGNLGLGHKSPVVTKPVLTLPSWSDVVQVVAAASHTSGFFPDGHTELVGGDVYGSGCCGNKQSARLTPVPSLFPPLKAYALGEAHPIGLLPDGTVRTSGGNILGAAGIGTWSEGHERLEPPGCYDTPQTPQVTHVSVVAAGKYFDLVLLDNGQIVGWGENQHGQLGITSPTMGTLIPRAAPHIEVPGIAIACGMFHSLVLRADGKVMGMGRAKFGEFGTLGHADIKTPTLISGLEGVIAIAAGGSQSMFLLNDNTVLITGRGKTWRKSAAKGKCTFISAGAVHTLVVCENEVWGEGQNEWGQLGDGTRTIIKEGVVVDDHTKETAVPLGIEAHYVSAGPIHSIAMA